MNKNYLIIILIIFLAVAGVLFMQKKSLTQSPTDTPLSENNTDSPLTSINPLSIAALRGGNYPGSDIAVEEKLPPGSNYQRLRVSYKSEGLKIYALLTIPNGPKPETGWPVIIFNHGYIPPKEYRTTERYIAYTDGFSRSGYILLRPDYRGHDQSEGEPSGAYGSNNYTIDVLSALSSMKKYPDADPKRIGMWGHSMGGFITLRAMVTDPDIKAGVIWAGVVGSYADMLTNWRRGSSTPRPNPSGSRGWRQALVELMGTPQENPTFWNSISANSYLSDISGPLQIHHGTNDTSVPIEFSQTLKTQMDTASKSAQLFTYPGDDHNLSQSFGTAMQRSIEFFDTYVKGTKP